MAKQNYLNLIPIQCTRCHRTTRTCYCRLPGPPAWWDYYVNEGESVCPTCMSADPLFLAAFKLNMGLSFSDYKTMITDGGSIWV